MGRYFKTARFQPADYAFEYPAQMLFTAIAKKDQETDLILGELDKMRQQATAKVKESKSNIGQGMFLPSDEESYQGEIDRFESEIDKVTQAVYDDPLNAGKNTRSINKLRSDINESLSTGSLYTLNKNYNDAQEWLEKNKDVDPTLLDAAFTKGMKSFQEAGGSISPDGTTKSIKDYLPTGLYDSDIQKEAFDFATKTDQYRNVSERADLVKLNLAENDDIQRTLWQQLDYGIMPDNKGGYYDPSMMTEAEKVEAVDKELTRQALIAAETTQKTRPPQSAGKGTKGEQTYEGLNLTSQPGKGIPEHTAIGKVISNNPNTETWEAVNTAIDSYEKALSEEGLNPRLKMIYGIEYESLRQQHQKAIDYTEQMFQMEADGQNTGIPVEMTPDRAERRGIYMNKYFEEEALRTTTVDAHVTWSDDFTVDQQKAIVSQVKDVVDDPTLFNDIVLRSSNPTIDGKTLNTLIAQNIIEPSITNRKEVDDAIQKYKGASMDGMADVKYDFENKLVIVKFKASSESKPDGEVLTREVPMTLGKGYANFSHANSEPIPTRTGNVYGETYFRMGVLFNGQTEDVYLSSSSVGSSTYNEVMSDPNIQAEVVGKAILNKFVSELGSKGNLGVKVNLNDDTYLTQGPNGVELITTDEGQTVKYTNPDVIATFLGIAMTPKYESDE